MESNGALALEVLGPLRIWRDGAPVDVGSRKQRMVLARLLVADRPVDEHALTETLWGDRPPASALSTLRAHVSRLRSSLGDRDGEAVIAHQAAGYGFAVALDVDAWRFEQLVAAARAQRGEPQAARDLLAEALALWRGVALEEFRYEPFAQPAIRRWDELRLTAVEDRAELDLHLGSAEELVPELEALAVEHPLRERVHGLLMRALYRAGRQADALAAYQRARAALADELGIEPSPDLRDLQHAVLNQAPHLMGRQQHDPPVTAANDDAAGHFGAAWSAALSQLPVPPLEEHLRCDLLLSRGRALRRTGRVEESREAFAAAVRLASAAEDGAQLAAAALGLAGPPEDTAPGDALDEALVTRAILELAPDDPVVAQLRARLAVSLIDRNDHVRGEQLMAAATAAARTSGDPEALAYVLRARRRSSFDPAALAERVAVTAELIGLGTRLRNDEILAWGERWRSIDLLELGELDAFDAAVTALENISGVADVAFHRWGVLVRRAGRALLREPAPTAEVAVLEAVAFTEQVQSPYTTAAAMHLLWACRWLQGRIGELEPAIVQLVAAMPTVGFHLPFLHAELDRPDEAAAALDRVAADGITSLLHTGNRAMVLLGLGMLGETVAYLGDAERAQQLYGLLAPYAGRLIVVPPGITALTTVDHCLGRLAATTGDAERSAGHFDSAIARCEEIGASVLAPRTQLAYAALLRHRGDPAAAQALAAEALERSAALGLVHPPALLRQSMATNR